MKSRIFNIQQIVFSVAMLLLISINTQAQSLEDALGFSETVNDVPEAPIHFLIPLALFIAAYLGIKKIKDN